MIYLPDTNAFSAYLAGRSPSLTARMQRAFAAGELRLSVMVLAELTFGAEKIRTKLAETKFTRRVETLRKRWPSGRRPLPRRIASRLAPSVFFVVGIPTLSSQL